MIALFFVTNRPGGLDVFEASLERQTVKPDVLLVVDELRRDSWFEDVGEKNSVSRVGNIISPPINQKNGEIRNLARSYNLAAETAVDLGCDLFISCQDYLWLPPDAIYRFKRLYENHGDSFLYAGLCSISRDPLVSEIDDLEGRYTIFKEPYKSKPQIIAWHDIRPKLYSGVLSEQTPIVTMRDPNHWEANWGAVPVELFRRGLRWDEEYDKGVAFENNDLALRACLDYDCEIILDSMNHVISLPHKKYWPKEEELAAEPNKVNQERYTKRFDEYVARLST